jgi:hypothetical protein
MAQQGLEQRVAELEQQVAELQQRVAAPDWRQALGMFTDRPEMLEVFKDAVKVREADRKRTHKPVRKQTHKAAPRRSAS